MLVNKTLLATLIAIGIAAVIPAGSADAATSATASGQTTFKVTLQPVLVLDYYQEIDLTVDSAALNTLVSGAGNTKTTQAVTATASGASLSADAALKTSTGGLKNISLTLKNTWSLRSILGKSSQTTVAIGLNSANGSSATLSGTADSNSKIALSAPGTSFTGSTGGTGFANPVYGDVTMTMDMSNATSADTYTGATIYITATST
ncbi:hypothetical protein ACO2Q2_14775 [Dyella sp. KRB-257]|uniref:hypothetical protein n=1 Tax=Dyella sp. KRB-257 TaxID=3400915 RepID=UPI003C087C3A